jgi:signal transduction histidine kinase
MVVFCAASLTERTAAVGIEEDIYVLSSLTPSRAQKRLALTVVLALFVTFLLVAGPLSHIQTTPVAAFVPAYTTALILSEGMTAFLLFSQFAIFRTRALLVISCGYLFAALTVFAWALTFPGVFGPTRLLGGFQSTPYLYFFWHIGFPIFVIAYALSKDTDLSRRSWNRRVRARIALSVTLTVSLVIAAASFFIVGNAVLPQIQVDPLRLSSVWLYLGVLVNIFALIVLWTRWRSVLDLWLMVVICAYAVEISLSYFPVPLRYSFGWYAGRAFGLFSSSLVLWVLLYEITTLYAVTAIVRVQRAKASLRTVQAELARVSRVTTLGQLAASIAHEITQPIASSRNNARAALNFLDRQPPDLSKVKQALQYVVADADRAGDIIGRIRDHIKKAPPRKDRFDLNEAINEVIVLARSTITENGVSVQIRLAEGRLPVHGDRTQLRQVVLNLILNALEAMSSVEAGARELLISTKQSETNGIVAAVGDSGPGIDAENLERIFEAFYTTKSSGLGIGLAICRSIIEAHGGRLWADTNEPRGAVFQFTLPGAENELTN